MELLDAIIKPPIIIAGVIALIWFTGGADFIFANPILIFFMILALIVFKVMSK